MRLYNVTYFGKNGKSSYGGFPLVLANTDMKTTKMP